LDVTSNQQIESLGYVSNLSDVFLQHAVEVNNVISTKTSSVLDFNFDDFSNIMVIFSDQSKLDITFLPEFYIIDYVELVFVSDLARLKIELDTKFNIMSTEKTVSTIDIRYEDLYNITVTDATSGELIITHIAGFDIELSNNAMVLIKSTDIHDVMDNGVFSNLDDMMYKPFEINNQIYIQSSSLDDIYIGGNFIINITIPIEFSMRA